MTVAIARLWSNTMTNWLLNDILWGMGTEGVHVLSVDFLGTGLGYCNASTTRIWKIYGAL